jgi:hypothetical protein
MAVGMKKISVRVVAGCMVPVCQIGRPGFRRHSGRQSSRDEGRSRPVSPGDSFSYSYSRGIGSGGWREKEKEKDYWGLRKEATHPVASRHPSF